MFLSSTAKPFKTPSLAGRWPKPPTDENRVTSLCRPVEDLENAGVSDAVRFAITVDGSDTEVEATREHPTIKVGYVRVAASFIDFEKLHQAGAGDFVDPHLLRESHQRGL